MTHHHSDSDNKTELALAIEQRPRKLYEFDVRGFFGLGDAPIPKAAVWVSRKCEENAAVEAAHVRVLGMPDNARQDPDVLQDAKSVEIITRAFRHPTRKSLDGTPYPLFPGPDWAHETFTTDQIAVCLNLYNEVRKKEGPQLWTIDDGLLEAMAIQCHDHVDDEVPEAVLAQAPREWITQAFVLLSHKLISERRDRDLLLDNAEGASARADRMQPTADAAAELAAAVAAGDPEQVAAAVSAVVVAANELATSETELAPDGPQTAAELVATLAADQGAEGPPAPPEAGEAPTGG